MNLTKQQTVLLSPFLIITINFVNAFLFGQIIGKWAFIPIILIEWVLFLYLVIRYAGKETIKNWLAKPKNSFAWNLLALFIGLLPLPLFIFHHDTLSTWQVWLPWILLALINPWLEEFYWRGLLVEYTQNWKKWQSIIFTSAVFSLNHMVFGVNSELNSGFTTVISTFIMGLVWSLVFIKTKSLRWIIFAHFLVDFFNLSAASFLDLYEKGGW
ncbi:CPBP family intramembrane glutamic endopeptidase [Chondrinema litorale]|uniref:CPBP family intramembrane glutamic endopeptidase n=1 Tax=Chondrinema litorale TaxID=2994555 RepID=UPI002543756C|nr:CPBP family intramembrane glutamic endopeptidase [Chondrinema litorale]UZR97980.1 CPBP family intramembrane metalloprotease [Chondrinema litorale]